MKVLCPTCGKLIPAQFLNLQSDVAVCEGCDEAFVLSDIVASGADAAIALDEPPRGAWFWQDFDGWQVGGTTRSLFGALFLVPFTSVWSGFSLGGIYGSQLVQREFNLPLSLFGLPFLAGSILLWSCAFMSICGRTTVTVDERGGRVFSGVGRIGWTRRFDWHAIHCIEEGLQRVNYPGATGACISMIGQTRLTFGGLLQDERRYFVLQALRQMLRERNSPGSKSTHRDANRHTPYAQPKAT